MLFLVLLRRSMVAPQKLEDDSAWLLRWPTLGWREPPDVFRAGWKEP
jgi:hypothetical protein